MPTLLTLPKLYTLARKIIASARQLACLHTFDDALHAAEANLLRTIPKRSSVIDVTLLKIYDYTLAGVPNGAAQRRLEACGRKLRHLPDRAALTPQATACLENALKRLAARNDLPGNLSLLLTDAARVPVYARTRPDLKAALAYYLAFLELANTTRGVEPRDLLLTVPAARSQAKAHLMQTIHRLKTARAATTVDNLESARRDNYDTQPAAAPRTREKQWPTSINHMTGSSAPSFPTPVKPPACCETHYPTPSGAALTGRP